MACCLPQQRAQNARSYQPKALRPDASIAYCADTSIAFRAAALEPLGARLLAKDNASAGFGHSGPVLWLYAAPNACAAHGDFRPLCGKWSMRSTPRALAAGGRDNGGARGRTEYGAGYFAAVVPDPDRNNIKSVCLEVVGQWPQSTAIWQSPAT